MGRESIALLSVHLFSQVPHQITQRETRSFRSFSQKEEGCAMKNEGEEGYRAAKQLKSF